MSASEVKAPIRHPYFGVSLGRWLGDLCRYGIDFQHIDKYKKITEQLEILDRPDLNPFMEAEAMGTLKRIVGKYFSYSKGILSC